MKPTKPPFTKEAWIILRLVKAVIDRNHRTLDSTKAVHYLIKTYGDRAVHDNIDLLHREWRKPT